MAGSSNNEQAATTLPLTGRVAIVTGASRGIGHAIALHLASLGANLALNYAANATKADHLASEINSLPMHTSHTRAIAVQADVANSAQVKNLFDRAEEAFGTEAHILVNCAGVIDSKYPYLVRTLVEDWDMTFGVNTKGSFLCCREAANRLARGGGGRIISISSSTVGGLPPGFAAYAASEAAVETMIKILTKELKGTKITANCVAPGPIATDMFFSGMGDDDVKKVVDECPLGRMGEPKDVAHIVGFLATDAGEWINGQVIRANGGTV